MSARPPTWPRAGFTAIEAVIALAVLAGAATLTAEMVTGALADRSRLEARAEAVEAAANMLEHARARSWDELTPEWAGSQVVPESLSRWPDSRLRVTVEPMPDRPRAKRVTAAVRWDREGREPWPAVVLTTVIAARTTEGKP